MASTAEQFGGRIRVRSCGVLIEGNSILLVNQKGLNGEKNWWSPPGGGVEFGEKIEEALKREFLEETGIQVQVGELLDLTEYINGPFHAVEFFYEVIQIAGELTVGTDPEMKDQIIQDVRFVSFEEVAKLPENQKHPTLNKLLDQ